MTELIMRVSEKDGKTEVTAMRELVRCKDCKHIATEWETDGGRWAIKSGNLMRCKAIKQLVMPDGFCSLGERREDD